VVLLVVLLASLFAFRFFILFAAALLLSLDRVPSADDVGFLHFVPPNEPPSLSLLLLKVRVAMLKKSTPDAEECSQLTPDVIVCIIFVFLLVVVEFF
jgi:hypothetical protein